MKIRKSFGLPWYAYKTALSCVLTLFLIIVHYAYFSVAQYGDWILAVFIMLVNLILWLVPAPAERILSGFIAICTFLYIAGQSLYYRLFGQYIFLSTALGLRSEAGDNLGIGLSYLNSRDFLFLALTLTVVVILVLLHPQQRPNKKQLKVMLAGSAGLLMLSLGCGLIFQHRLNQSYDDFYYTYSDKYVFDKVGSTRQFVELFGPVEFFVRDFQLNCIEPLYQKQHATEYREQIEVFLNANLSRKDNEQTGLFKEKNLIFFEGESLTQAVIDPVLTPTLYQLQNEGFDFPNYYAPLLQGSTSDADFMLNLGLLPNNEGMVAMQQYGTNVYPTSLARGFKSLGYSAIIAHNGNKEFYNRDIFYPNIGYDDFWDLGVLGPEYGTSDAVCMDIINWMIDDSEPFFLYNITFSGHQGYDPQDITDHNDETAAEYQASYQTVDQQYPDLSEQVKVYLAKSMSLDKAVASAIEHARQQGTMDKLVIAVVGDHHVKGFTDQDNLNTQAILTSGASLKDVPFFIWTPEMEGRSVDKPCTDIDALPTLFNLFGIDYDCETVMGSDIFNPDYVGYYANDNQIVTGNFTYDLRTRQFQNLKIEEEQARKEAQRYLQYNEIANLILKTNYFESSED